MSTHLEVERKYDLPADQSVPDLTAVPGVARVDEPVEHALDAVYYDTEDLRLHSHRVVLRRRRGGADAGWHLKRPAGADRSETQLPDGGDDAVPDELVAEVGEVAGGADLTPVARIRTRRRERAVRNPEGTVLAVLADDLVTAESFLDGSLQRWRELEVELVDGDPALLAGVDTALRAAGVRPASGASKLARTLEASEPARTLEASEPARTLEASKPAGRGRRPLVDYLVEQRNTILATEPGVRAGDGESIHQMRVATRRLRASLRTFRPLLDETQLGPLGDELRWLGGVLGDARDADVLAGRLTAAVHAEPDELVVGPVAARIRQRLAADTARSGDRLTEALDSGRFAVLIEALDRLVADAGGRGGGRRRLTQRAAKALRRADALLDTAISTPAAAKGSRRGSPTLAGLLPATDRDTRLHDARKAYKRARYAAEAIAALDERPAKRLVKRLKELQDLLGDHQDTLVAREVLRDYGMRAYGEGENAFTYGLLHARQADLGEQALAGLDRVRRRAGRRKVRRWLAT
jgi:CHAD domain-containing protein